MKLLLVLYIIGFELTIILGQDADSNRHDQEIDSYISTITEITANLSDAGQASATRIINALNDLKTALHSILTELDNNLASFESNSTEEAEDEILAGVEDLVYAINQTDIVIEEELNTLRDLISGSDNTTVPALFDYLEILIIGRAKLSEAEFDRLVSIMIDIHGHGIQPTDDLIDLVEAVYNQTLENGYESIQITGQSLSMAIKLLEDNGEVVPEECFEVHQELAFIYVNIFEDRLSQLSSAVSSNMDAEEDVKDQIRQKLDALEDTVTEVLEFVENDVKREENKHPNIDRNAVLALKQKLIRILKQVNDLSESFESAATYLLV